MPTQFPLNLDVSTLSGSDGFAITGFPANSMAGWSVSSAGDINGDGISDLLIGVPYQLTSGAGLSYVIFGQKNIGGSGSLNIANLNGNNGFVINGFPSSAEGGESVSSAGDINGDGFADLVIGAPSVSSGIGEAYVAFGSSSIGSSGMLSVSSLTGSNGFAITGFPAAGVGSLGGFSVSKAGDVNDDGFEDLVIGAPYYSNEAGAAFVLFGQKSIGSSGIVSVSSLTGSSGFVITGFPATSHGGWAVNDAGDINADGVADLIIGAPWLAQCYVIFGMSGIGSSGSLDVSTLNGSNGFLITGQSGGLNSGTYLRETDINGDGISDLLLGDTGGASGAGIVYVIFGKNGVGNSGSFALSTLNGNNGFIITGFPASSSGGYSIGNNADINSDGIMDLLVGAYGAASNTGVVYVVFGQSGIGSSGSLSLSNLTGNNGFVITNFPAGGYAGRAVCFIEDINGDGVSDLVIGAPFASSQAGASYIVFGKKADLVVSNRLIVNEGQTQVFSSQYLNATNLINPLQDGKLFFRISAIQHGRFFSTINTTASLTHFFQWQVQGGQIQFAHDGSVWPPAYNVTVGYVDQLAVTQPQAVSVIFHQEFILVNNFFSISQGQTIILTTSNLSANDLYNSANDPNIIFSISSIQHGHFALTNNPAMPVTSFTQTQIQSGAVQFVQDGTLNPPSFDVTVINGAASLAPQSALISFDGSPIITKNSLKINQNQTVVLTLNNLNVTDPSSVRFNFTVSGVQHGYFSLITAPLISINSFTPSQIRAGQVQFKQDGSVNPPSYSVTASDGQLNSITQAASIIFDVFPTLVTNTLTINQGQTVILSSSDLSAVDSYNPSNNPNLIFSVSNAQHGYFALTSAPTTPVTSFTQAQIQSGNIQFVHDGGSNPPSFDVAVTNGVGSIAPQACVISFDVLPILTANSLTISQGQTVVLTTSDLSTADPFSSSFTFTVSSVQNGYFALVSAPLKPVSTFTQIQVQSGQIQFVQDGSANPPSYLVSVSDGRMTSSAQASSITFHSILSLTRNTLTLDAGQSVILTPQNLNATDLGGSSFAQIIFTVADVTNGYFAYVDFPTVPILSFSQADINSGQVEFVSTSSNQAPSCSIAVSDGTATVSPVPMTITFGDAPQIIVNQITISQGGTQFLNLNHLHAQAPGATNTTLLFLVNDVHHGQFENYGQLGTAIGNFTQQQLINSNIQFVHDDSNFAPGYSLTAWNTDGFSGSGKKLVFHVSALSAAPSIGYSSAASPAKVWFQAGGITLPQLKYNRLYIMQGGKAVLSSQQLLAIDPQGAPVFNTTFLINGLTHGQFTSVINPTLHYLNFSQSQVAAGEIQFIHDGSANVPSYQIIVNQGPYFSAPYPASIAFQPMYSPPKIIGQLPNQTITVDEAFSFPLTTSIFSDTAPLHFSASIVGGSQLPSWIHFDNTTNYFSGVAATPGITPIQVTAKDAAHLTASTFFSLKAQPQLQPQSHTSSSGAIIGGVLGGVIGLMLLVMRWYIGRQAQITLQKAVDEATQKNTRVLAKEIHKKMKLTGCCGYLSESNAKAYIKAIENIVSKLDLADKIQPLAWIDEIATQIKKQANKSFCYSFFKPEISPQELSDKTETIVRSVQQTFSADVEKSITPTSEDIEMSDMRVLPA